MRLDLGVLGSGDFVVIRKGRDGSQMVRIVRAEADGFTVRGYLRKKKTWTDPKWIGFGKVKYRVEPGPALDLARAKWTQFQEKQHAGRTDEARCGTRDREGHRDAEGIQRVEATGGDARSSRGSSVAPGRRSEAREEVQGQLLIDEADIPY